MTANERRGIRHRADGRCEYCLRSDATLPLPFQIDHILAQKHGGLTVTANLAYSCPGCNGKKGPNLSGVDPMTDQVVRLFDPRRQRWADHFRYAGARLIGRTSTGRATIKTLGINDPLNVAARAELIAEGLF